MKMWSVQDFRLESLMGCFSMHRDSCIMKLEINLGKIYDMRCAIMKNTKKILAWMLLAAIPLTGAASAESVQRAAASVEIQDFEHYPSYSADAQTGRWSLRANEADAVAYRFEDYVDSNSGELCAFWLEVNGNAQTGVWTPVLCVRYEGSEEIEARAVSFLADGVRYDLAARTVSAEDEPEMICAPLNRQAVEALRGISGAEDVQLRLLGEDRYTAEIDPDTTNTRRRIEAASLNGLEAGFALLDSLGVQEYGLWDLSEADWQQQYGFKPLFEKHEVMDALGEAAIADDFGVVKRGDQNSAAKAAQEILIDAGFLSGSAATSFGSGAEAAARRAQQYLGLVETGCVDVHLADALQKGRAAEKEKEVQWQALGDTAQVAVDRFWLADGAAAMNAPESVQTAANSDNVLLVADGRIRNVSGNELKLFMDVEAKAVFNGEYEYEAVVLCEVNGGTALDMMLLPMADARMIVYAEVPAALAKESGWVVRLTAGEASVEYVLE